MILLAIILSVYFGLNVLTIILTSMLIADETNILCILFPMTILYRRLRERYTLAGSLIPTILISPFMILHIIFLLLLGVLAGIWGLVEAVWDMLFIKNDV